MSNDYSNLRKNLNIAHQSRRIMRFGILPLVSLIAFALFFRIEGFFTLDDLSIFLTVTGLLFGLLAAFTIARGWERVSIIRQQASAEVSAYINIVKVAKHYNNKVFHSFTKAIRAYITELASTNFKDCPHNKKLERKFSNIFDITKDLRMKKQEDWTLLSSIISDIKTASSARTLQNAVVLSPMSHIRLEVIYLLAIVIVGGFFLTEHPNESVGALTTAAITAVVGLLLILVYDLDNISYQYGHVTQYQYEGLLAMIDEEDPDAKKNSPTP